MEIIAHIHTDFSDKFGIPRQSGLTELKGKIIFEAEYRNVDALRGLDGFNYIWLIWQFSEHINNGWSPTVRPPRLGGNKRLGVFATRSPFRPNPIGLSCVKLEKIEWNTPQGPILHVIGADLMDNTPIYDIKPYLPFVDCHNDAVGGFAEPLKDKKLTVEIKEENKIYFSSEQWNGLIQLLEQDPRPAYQNNEQRIYGMSFAGKTVKFKVSDDHLIVTEISDLP